MGSVLCISILGKKGNQSKQGGSAAAETASNREKLERPYVLGHLQPKPRSLGVRIPTECTQGLSGFPARLILTPHEVEAKMTIT